MRLFPFNFKKTPRKFLGIDIGTSTIRIVELGRRGNSLSLDNYGEVKISRPQKISIGQDVVLLSNQDTAKVLTAVLREAGIETKDVNFSIPDFSSFFTSFELPAMSEKEIEQAIRYEARSYIPLPLAEVTLDWQIAESQVVNKKSIPSKVLVVAVPNDVIQQYQQISSLSGLQVKSLEAEVFALSRPFTKKQSETTSIIDLGARSTTCNIFDKGFLETSHSFNISGNQLTEILSRSLKLDYQQAEEAKKEYGLGGLPGVGQDTKDIMLPLIDSILTEIKKTFRNFYQQKGQEVHKVILAGSSALMPGLPEYFSKELKMPVEIANPFIHISFPPILEEIIKEIGPSYAIAVGLALKGLE